MLHIKPHEMVYKNREINSSKNHKHPAVNPEASNNDIAIRSIPFSNKIIHV